jgi:riboflavin synthase
MFSGIVEGTGKVIEVIKHEDHIQISISCKNSFWKGVKKGASISVNGVCLTLTNIPEDFMSFDVVQETQNKTNISFLNKNDFVNLERSMQANTEIGGHLISGHVHTKAKVIDILDKDKTRDIKFKIDENYSKYIFEKGYVGINGCSLTVGKKTKKWFEVYLIPETLSKTNLKYLKKDDYVNIECDQNTITIVDTTERILNR